MHSLPHQSPVNLKQKFEVTKLPAQIASLNFSLKEFEKLLNVSNAK